MEKSPKEQRDRKIADKMGARVGGRREGPGYSLIRIAADDSPTLQQRLREALAELNSSSIHIDPAVGSGQLRLAFVTTAEQASRLISSSSPDDIIGSARPPRATKPKIAFLFPGLDLDGIARCHFFLRQRPEYLDFLSRADRLVGARLNQSLSAYLDSCRPSAPSLIRRSPAWSTDGREALAHSALITVECALAETWRGLGIEPDAVAGYSLGEFAAAWIAGAYDFETVISMVLERALAVEALPRTAMLAVAADYRELSACIGPNVHLVASNSSDQTILGGARTDLESVRADLQLRGFLAEVAAGDHAFHTPLMASAATVVEDRFRELEAQPLAMPLVSTVTGRAVVASALDAAHWAKHLTKPVQFQQALTTLEELGADFFLEVGPGQSLSALVQSRPPSNPAAEIASSMPSYLDTRPPAAHFLRTAGRLWAAGAPLSDGLQDLGVDRADTESPAAAPDNPRSPLLGTIQRVCADVLGMDRIEPEANLFDFGVNSLTLARIGARLNEKLGRHLSMKDILAHPTPAGLAAYVGEHRSSEQDQAYVTFPGGLRVCYQSASEARYFHKSIFEDRSYLQHGLAIQAGDIVFDVGANIGLFSIFCALEAPDVQLFAFEPVPQLFSLLRRNTNEYCDNITLFAEGVGDVDGDLPITFYPNSPGMSSFAAELEDEKHVLGTILENQRRLGDPDLGEILENKDEYLEARLDGQRTNGRVRRLSHVIAQTRVPIIDFLKVDCQKYELKVLQGIDEACWPLIRQAVVEVHDEDDRLRTISALLASRGFIVEIDQDELYKGTDIHLVYARRARTCAQGRA